MKIKTSKKYYYKVNKCSILCNKEVMIEMKKNFKVFLINVSIVSIFSLITLQLLYFFHGSLETIPTDEQNDKVRISIGLILFILVTLEITLLIVRRKTILNRNSKNIK
jgi:hypothetical protein